MNMCRNKFTFSAVFTFAPLFLIFNSTACFAQTTSTVPTQTAVSTDCAAIKSAPPNASEWSGSELNKAVIYSDAKKIRKLLKQKTDVNEKDSFGNTPLINAVARRIAEPNDESAEKNLQKARSDAKIQLEIAELLLKNGADANVKGFEGRTPLINAVIADESVAVRLINLLVQNKENVNAQDNRGFTALMEAARTNRIEIIKILLKSGADKNLKNCENQTAASIAEQFNLAEAVQILN